MRHAGDVIENPVTRERMVFLQTAAETGGALLEIAMSVAPGGFVAAAHVHPRQEERFVVRAGALTLRRGAEERTYAAGEGATVAAGVPHAWWNGGDETLEVVVQLRPAGRFDAFITTAFALAQLGRTDARGMPGLLQLAATARAYADEIYPASPPRAVQRLLFALLAPAARLLGYRADVDYPGGRGACTTPDGPPAEVAGPADP